MTTTVFSWIAAVVVWMSQPVRWLFYIIASIPHFTVSAWKQSTDLDALACAALVVNNGKAVLSWMLRPLTSYFYVSCPPVWHTHRQCHSQLAPCNTAYMQYSKCLTAHSQHPPIQPTCSKQGSDSSF